MHVTKLYAGFLQPAEDDLLFASQSRSRRRTINADSG